MMQLFIPHSLWKNGLIKLPRLYGLSAHFISGITSYTHTKAFCLEM